MLSYFNGGTSENIVDPTPNKKWLRIKAMSLNRKLVIPSNNAAPPNCPDTFKDDFNNLNQTHGWSKTLENIPCFTVSHINDYSNKINEKYASKSKVVKKHFKRGEQFIEEKYIDLNSVYTKQSDDYFCIKGLCGASLKAKDRWIFAVLCKSSANVEFSFCFCRSGKPGTCSHTYALLKMVAKWVLDGRTEIPIQKACTSTPCVWSVPQSRGRTEKPKISELTIISPLAKKAKTSDDIEDSSTRRSSGISSSLYNPCVNHDCNESISKTKELIAELRKSNPNLHFLEVANPDANLFVETKFGSAVEGSPLAVQTALISPSFSVYTNNLPQPMEQNDCVRLNYPAFPFQNPSYRMERFLDVIVKSKDERKILLLESLWQEIPMLNQIETKTRDQAASREWFQIRKNRFTASLCNKIKSVKTDRGLKNLAQKHVFKTEKVNPIAQMKMDHGKFYEPIAISSYEKFLFSKGYSFVVEHCGLVIDQQNYVLGASPDGKVQVDGKFGIIEVKCSEEYKNVDPKDICFMSESSCLKYDKINDKISLDREHSYYDQIQMQLGITCQTFCDFILYTTKGMVIDRINYDCKYWESLSDRILKFYFEHMLDFLIEKQDEELNNMLLQDQIPLQLQQN